MAGSMLSCLLISPSNLERRLAFAIHYFAYKIILVIFRCVVTHRRQQLINPFQCSPICRLIFYLYHNLYIVQTSSCKYLLNTKIYVFFHSPKHFREIAKEGKRKCNDKESYISKSLILPTKGIASATASQPQ